MKKKNIMFVTLITIMFVTVISFSSNLYAASGSWKKDSTGWWYSYSGGGYAIGWQKIGGSWYYFTSDGYMDYSEYRDGYWLNADGSWNTAYSGGHWASDSKGWWYTDNSGWYPTSTWLWIDGSCYYFKADGYMAHDENIGGYYVNSSGARTSGSASSSASHTHSWVLVKDAWDEKVLVKDAWDEQVIDHYDTVDEPHCMDCDAYMPPGPPCPNCGGWDAYTKTIQTPVYKTVHHDAEYKTVHHDAEYKCSTCGATK